MVQGCSLQMYWYVPGFRDRGRARAARLQWSRWTRIRPAPRLCGAFSTCSSTSPWSRPPSRARLGDEPVVIGPGQLSFALAMLKLETVPSSTAAVSRTAPLHSMTVGGAGGGGRGGTVPPSLNAHTAAIHRQRDVLLAARSRTTIGDPPPGPAPPGSPDFAGLELPERRRRSSRPTPGTRRRARRGTRARRPSPSRRRRLRTRRRRARFSHDDLARAAVERGHQPVLLHARAASPDG